MSVLLTFIDWMKDMTMPKSKGEEGQSLQVPELRASTLVSSTIAYYVGGDKWEKINKYMKIFLESGDATKRELQGDGIIINGGWGQGETQIYSG